MPHCQKENHDHRAKSKKDRQKKKEAIQARKKAAKLLEEEELEKEKIKLANNIALADGFGEYEVGCEPEKELLTRFNLKKRSKKHLRIDVRREQQRKEKEEEERLRQEQEEKYRLEQEKLKQTSDDKDEEDDVITEERLVYICLCCHKKFNSTNQFQNHTNSKRHKENAALFEEAGVIVTEVKLKKDFEDISDDISYDFETEQNDQRDEEKNSDDDEYENANDTYEEDDYEETKPKKSVFNAFAAFSDSESSSDSSDDESDKEEKEQSEIVKPTVCEEENEENFTNDDSSIEYDDDLALLEEIVFQNRLQEQFYPDDKTDEKKDSGEIIPLPFDDEQYIPDFFTADEKRIAAVRHRLQKRLAAKGIQPNQKSPELNTTDAVAFGKTLLQQVMEASVDTLEEKLATYNRHKAEYQLLKKDFQFAKGNSKALAAQYTFRIDPADNQRRRENIHHTGSHYHMQASRSMQFGRRKGMMARHSAQGARLQASRMAAKEMAAMHGKGMKIGKTSKKSQQKRRGEAGGSKKTGGVSTGDN